MSATFFSRTNHEVGINNYCDLSMCYGYVFANLKPINILLLRCLKPGDVELMQKLIENKDKIILHYIVSGYGSTPLEPAVPHPAIAYKSLQTLIQLGFPKKQIVLRIDPVLPSEQGLIVVNQVLNVFRTLGIKRCRFSFLKQNQNVKTRAAWMQFFCGPNVNLNPYYSELYGKIFNYAAGFQRKDMCNLAKKWDWHYTFETCSRDDKDDFNEYEKACVSFDDYKRLGIRNFENPQEVYTRKNKCKCPDNVVELYPQTNMQCGLKCVHCKYKTLYI